MDPLNIARINITAPYKVWNEEEAYRFETENGISYVVDFDPDDNPYYRCYWFNLTNPRHTKSPGDIKIAQTVVLHHRGVLPSEPRRIALHVQ